jgi:uncharacterized protein YidB (DUF937 family)
LKKVCQELGQLDIKNIYKESKEMSLFDSVINEAGERFGLEDKSGTLLSALLSLMTDQNRGGFAGFLDLFSQAGLGDLVASWISSGTNKELSEEQVESALGDQTITVMANQADINASTAKAALAYMIPHIVDKLTPEGIVPEEKDLLSKIGDFLSGTGGTIGGATPGAADAVGRVTGNTTDKIGETGSPVVGKGVEIAGKGVGTIGDAGKKAFDAAGDVAGGTLNKVSEVFDSDDNGDRVFKWLLPLILLGLFILLGSWFCGKPPEVKITEEVNTNKTGNADSNANTNSANE